MPPASIISIIESQIGAAIVECEAVGGGCISNATRVKSESGDFFLKWSNGEAAKTFPTEASSLAAMHRVQTDLIIPEAILARDASDGTPGVLLMNWIDSGTKSKDFWEVFGRGLAQMHRSTVSRYGFAEDNFIGRIPQRNTWEDSWVTFFREHRLEPQVARARKNRRWEASWDKPLDRLYAHLADVLPANPEASILHGDLWGGNYMVELGGRPVLIDPASYYGHREADLAMTELFSGFDRRFYDAYRSAWPIESGYEERRQIYNLYHLVNHLNHFGSGYSNSVAGILRTY